MPQQLGAHGCVEGMSHKEDSALLIEYNCTSISNCRSYEPVFFIINDHSFFSEMKPFGTVFHKHCGLLVVFPFFLSRSEQQINLPSSR